MHLHATKPHQIESYFRMHKFESVNGIIYRVDNPYSANKCYIYFFSDVPHLIKTVRNAWSNSLAHSNTRPFWVRLCTLHTKAVPSIAGLHVTIFILGGEWRMWPLLTTLPPKIKKVMYGPE